MIFVWILRSIIEFSIALNADLFEVLDLSVWIDNLQTLSLYFFDILKYVFYFLPVPYLMPLLTVIFMILFLRISIALVRTLLPFW